MKKLALVSFCLFTGAIHAQWQDSTNIGNAPPLPQSTQIYQRPAPMTIADEYFSNGGGSDGSNAPATGGHEGGWSTGFGGSVTDNSGNAVSGGGGMGDSDTGHDGTSSDSSSDGGGDNGGGSE